MFADGYRQLLRQVEELPVRDEPLDRLRDVARGFVRFAVAEPAQADFATRELEALLDPDPLITPVLLKTAGWIANYYGSSMESVIRSVLPEGVRSEENSAKTRRIAVLVAQSKR